MERDPTDTLLAVLQYGAVLIIIGIGLWQAFGRQVALWIGTRMVRYGRRR